MNTPSWRQSGRVLFALAVLLIPSGRSVRAGECPCGGAVTARQLARMDLAQLDALFCQGKVGCLPVGYGKGRVLLMLDARRPRLRAALSGTVWKGKHFPGDGRMVNQWVGFRAVEAAVRVEPSFFDGEPCIHLDYPPSAPVFGNAWDELREIAPGVLLGRVYERSPKPRLQGYFVLEMTRK